MGRLAATCAATGVALVFFASVALPLATYTTALALFGLAHVGSEFRYIDHRFALRLGHGLFLALGLLLCGAVLARLGGMTGTLDRSAAAMAEIGFGAAMVALMLRRGGRAGAMLAAALGLALVTGAWAAPFLTLLAFAVGHNLTPIALLAERFAAPADRATRRRVLAVAATGLVGLPLLIATGIPFDLLAARGLVDPEASLFAGGDLLANLGAYVPASAWQSDWALHAFSAAVFAQCMHYVATIGVLPRLIAPGDRPALPWPSPRRFASGLAALCAALAIAFALDYAIARRVYAIAALVHAWIEIPILVLVVAALQRQTMASPSPPATEAAFAAAETASALPRPSGTSSA